MTPLYLHHLDIRIDRDNKRYPASAVVFNADGDFIFRFDKDWSDDQIKVAVDFANTAYAKGVATGAASKLREIQSALGVGALMAEMLATT